MMIKKTLTLAHVFQIILFIHSSYDLFLAVSKMIGLETIPLFVIFEIS